MWHTWGREEVFTGLWLGGTKGRPMYRWEDNIKMYLREIGINGVNWTGWLRIESSGRLLGTWY
jgi:hypothetical protein